MAEFLVDDSQTTRARIEAVKKNAAKREQAKKEQARMEQAKRENDFIKALRVLNPADQYNWTNAGATTYRRGSSLDPMTPVLLNPDGNNPATIQAHERNIMNGVPINPADQYGSQMDPNMEGRTDAENAFMNNIRDKVLMNNSTNSEKVNQITSSDFIKNLRENLSNIAKFFGADIKNNQSSTTQSTNNSNQNTSDDSSDDYIEYTYKKGDTFGQVIKDLGLKTNKGLWGSDGDVAYYTKQLRQQGIPGMVPIGTKIRLKRRK